MIDKIVTFGRCCLRVRIFCLRTYLSLKTKQQSENTLAIAEVSCPLNELVKYKPVVAKWRFHLLSAAHD
jgi:hypothetical protein